MDNETPWPRGVAKPAQRALEAAGAHKIEDLTTWRFAELAALRGMGPRAIVAIETALAARNLTLKGGTLRSASTTMRPPGEIDIRRPEEV